MRLLLQRVASASVTVQEQQVSAIGKGLLILVGVAPTDGEAEVEWLADKALGLRIFPDAQKPMNRSVLDVGGEVLVVSQFTLTADTSRGKRPSFTTAAAPAHAETIYESFVSRLGRDVAVATGVFGADMQVALVNDGPVTFLLEK